MEKNFVLFNLRERHLPIINYSLNITLNIVCFEKSKATKTLSWVSYWIPILIMHKDDMIWSMVGTKSMLKQKIGQYEMSVS